MTGLPILAAGAGALVVLSPDLRREFGVLLAGAGVIDPAYVTAAHRAAMERLNVPLLGVPAGVGSQASARYAQLFAASRASRGFVMLSGPPWVGYPKFTREDLLSLFDAFIGAVGAGVAEVDAGTLGDREGYRMTDAKVPGLDNLNAKVFEKIKSGDRPTTARLTVFGESVLELARERLRVREFAVTLDYPKAHLLVTRLATSMDNAGYLLGGKPAAHPTIWSGAGDLLGDGLTGLVGAVVGSSLFWFAGLGLVAFKVLR